jgi:sugar O-acyltransferase (sialic acid O-acetyltransferase NeuD family)
MKKIAIAGAGGFAKEVYLLLADINAISKEWKFAGFFDDGKPKGKFFMDLEIAGTIDDLNNDPSITEVVIGVGRSTNIISICNKLDNGRINFPNLIHPTSYTHPASLKIGKGNILQRGTTLSAENTVGNFNIFNADVRIGHDVTIGDYNSFGTFSMISGGVLIGDRNNFGICSGILQYKVVGNDNVIAPMSMLYRSVADNGHYIGAPARPSGL